MKWIGVGQKESHQGVAGLVIGRVPLLLLVHHHGSPLFAHEHLVLGLFKVIHSDGAAVEARRIQRRLVDEVGQLST